MTVARDHTRGLWLNTQLGYADQFYGALAAREAGNPHVMVERVRSTDATIHLAFHMDEVDRPITPPAC